MSVPNSWMPQVLTSRPRRFFVATCVAAFQASTLSLHGHFRHSGQAFMRFTFMSILNMLASSYALRMWRILFVPLIADGNKLSYKDVKSFRHSRSTTMAVALVAFCAFATNAQLIGSLWPAADPTYLSLFAFTCLGAMVLIMGADAVVSLFVSARRQFKCRPTEPRQRAQLLLVTCVIVIVTALFEATDDPIVFEIEATLQNLPKAMDGFVLVAMSDIHIGPTVGISLTSQVARVVENSGHYDMLALAGDIVDGYSHELTPALQPLRHLADRARYGAYYVTGNHDVMHGDVDAFMSDLQSHNIIPLRNTRISVFRNDPQRTITMARQPQRDGDTLAPLSPCDGFEVGGVDDAHSLRLGPNGYMEDVPKALKGWSPPKQQSRGDDGGDDGGDDVGGASLLFLAHQPNTNKHPLLSQAELIFNGHTHGGQMFPLHLPVWLGNAYFAGVYPKDIGGWTTGKVVVSRGANYFGPPMRLFASRDVYRITFRSGGNADAHCNT